MFSPGEYSNDSIAQLIPKPATSLLKTRSPPAATSAVKPPSDNRTLTQAAHYQSPQINHREIGPIKTKAIPPVP
jgi:hypothetical protein